MNGTTNPEIRHSGVLCCKGFGFGHCRTLLIFVCFSFSVCLGLSHHWTNSRAAHRFTWPSLSERRRISVIRRPDNSHASLGYDLNPDESGRARLLKPVFKESLTEKVSNKVSLHKDEARKVILKRFNHTQGLILKKPLLDEGFNATRATSTTLALTLETSPVSLSTSGNHSNTEHENSAGVAHPLAPTNSSNTTLTQPATLQITVNPSSKPVATDTPCGECSAGIDCLEVAKTINVSVSNLCNTKQLVQSQSKNNHFQRLNQTKIGNEMKVSQSAMGKEVVILNWSGEKYIEENLVVVGDALAPFSNCAYTNCRVTWDRASLSAADLVVYHSGSWSRFPPMPPVDWGRQVRVFTTREAEQHFPHPMATDEDAIFNYSMTYLPHSDIVFDYCLKRYWTIDDHRMDINAIFSRPRVAFHYVSNCFGPRLKLSHALGALLPVDIYGACTRRADGCQPISFHQRLIKSVCAKKLRMKYKFYFAFENSICDSYITEKLWKVFADGVIPIVMGPPREQYERVAPPGSFIHVHDFPNLTALAAHVNQTLVNRTLFESYHLWRYTSWQPPRFGDIAHCELCRLANEKPKRQLQLSKLFNSRSHCKPWSI